MPRAAPRFRLRRRQGPDDERSTHYGRDGDGVDMGLYVIGDYVQARPTFLLTYGCDSLTYRKMVIEERR